MSQTTTSCDAMDPTATPLQSSIPLPSTGPLTSTNISSEMPDIKAAIENAREFLRRPCIADGLVDAAEIIEQSVKDEEGAKLERFKVSSIRAYCTLWFEKHPAVSALFKDENSNRPYATAYRKIEASRVEPGTVTDEELLDLMHKTMEFTIDETKQLHTICKEVPQYYATCEKGHRLYLDHKEVPRSRSRESTPLQGTKLFGMLEKTFPNPAYWSRWGLPTEGQTSFEEDAQEPDKEHPNFGNPKYRLTKANLRRILQEVEESIPEIEITLDMNFEDLAVLQLLCRLIMNNDECLTNEYLKQYLSQMKKAADGASNPTHFPYLIYDIQQEPSYFTQEGFGTYDTTEKWSFFFILKASQVSGIWDQLFETSSFEDQCAFFEKFEDLQLHVEKLEEEAITHSKDLAEIARSKEKSDTEHTYKIKELARAKEKIESDLERSTSDLLQSREIQNLREEKLKSELETKETQLQNTQFSLEKSSKQIQKMKNAAKKKFTELQDEVDRRGKELKDVNQELEILKLDHEAVTKCAEGDKVVIEEKEKEISILRKERDESRLSLSKAKAEILQERTGTADNNNKPDTPPTRNEIEERRKKLLAESKASGFREQSTTNQLLEKNVELMDENKRILKEGEGMEEKIGVLSVENQELRAEVEVLREKVRGVLELLRD